jgi:hypothetical protein
VNSQTTLNNPLAPFVETSIRATDGKWVKVFFLIDLGADGTYLPSEYLKKLGLQLDEAKSEYNVTGVGGQKAKYVPFTTQLRFRSNITRRTFDLEIGIFTQEESLDIPVLRRENSSSFLFDQTFSFRKRKSLGRDVINFFTFLCDLKANLVWLIDEADRMKLLRFCDAIERNKIPLT